MLRRFIAIYLTVLLIMLCTCVPFNLMRSYVDSKTHIERLVFFSQYGGYAPAWHNYVNRSSGYTTIAVIDYKRLTIQIIIVTMIIAIIYLVTSSIKKTKPQNNAQIESTAAGNTTNNIKTLPTAEPPKTEVIEPPTLNEPNIEGEMDQEVHIMPSRKREIQTNPEILQAYRTMNEKLSKKPTETSTPKTPPQKGL